MSVAIEEQETVIQISRSDSIAYVWTSDKTMMTKLDKLCETSPGMYRVIETGTSDGEIVNKRYRITNKRMVSFRSAPSKRRMSQEQKDRAKESLQRYRNSKLPRH